MAAPNYPTWLRRLAAGHRRVLPVRPHRPLVLSNYVGNRKVNTSEVTCLEEMAFMMSCWKEKEFSDVLCAKEIKAFCDCVAKTDMEYKERCKQESLSQTGNLTSEKVNKLLRRFPNITHDF
uniref:Coiled-coil-helix-coiled-coil-helix domain containing 1 n=1 Tax=Pelusios castaneus TaxID=367368 RepID=A0A8C8VQN4_9SAUR